MPKDPFDFSDMSDLPEGIAAALEQSNPGERSKYLRVLRRAGRPVTAKEIRAAYYREYGIDRPQNVVAAALTWLKKSGQVKQPKHGYWKAV
jgi:hypothetical protein